MPEMDPDASWSSRSDRGGWETGELGAKAYEHPPKALCSQKERLSKKKGQGLC